MVQNEEKKELNKLQEFCLVVSLVKTSDGQMYFCRIRRSLIFFILRIGRFTDLKQKVFFSRKVPYFLSIIVIK